MEIDSKSAILTQFSPYIEVKVDVDKAIALPIGSLMIELSNLPILLFNDLEARSVRLTSPIISAQCTL